MEIAMKLKASAVAGLILCGIGTAHAGSATYSVTFDSAWSQATHPVDYPASAHFSRFVGATHGAGYAIFKERGMASDGLKRVAEMGAPSPHDAEIQKAISGGAAGQMIRGEPVKTLPGSSTMSFTADDAHAMVSIVTMVAPSPDWFTGVSGLALKDKGKWIDRKVVTVYAWDAGTDSGATFLAPDQATSPREAVHLSESSIFVAKGKRVPTANSPSSSNPNPRRRCRAGIERPAARPASAGGPPLFHPRH
jgi:hypothetical protein